MSNQPPGPFLFDPLPDEPENKRQEDERSGRGPDPESPQADKRQDRPSEEPSQLLEEARGQGAAIDSTAQPNLPDSEQRDAGARAPVAQNATTPGQGRRPQQVLFEEPGEGRGEAEVVEPHRRHGEVDPERVGPLARLTSGLLDLSAVLAVALIALLAARLMGIEPGVRLLPGVVLFVVVFSFAYHVFPLLFWGRTPGMALADLVTRDPSGKSLTAWQSTLRWAGSLGTVILAGIPMIVSWFTGWSLADLVSGSETKVDST